MLDIKFQKKVILNKIVFKTLIYFLITFVISLITFNFYSNIFGIIVFCILTTLFIFNHLNALIKLENWLNKPTLSSVPIGNDYWEPIYSKLYKLYKNHTLTKKDLTKALDQFVAGAQALPDGVASLNEYNEILWANKNIQKMLGIELPKDLKKPINYFVRNTKFLKLIEGDLDNNSINIILDENHFQINLIKFGFDNKLLICRDIVNETRLEETRKQFISDVSHELKTPLTVILGNAELLLDRQSKNSEDNKLIESLINQAERMNYLIKDLMALSSIDALKKNLRNEKIFITELFKQINEDLSIYSKKDNNIFFSCEAKSNKNLIGSINEIKSAIQNLVSNAFRYTEKGFIKVTWYEEKFNGILSVKDTGIGIPKEHINKVTERFYRVNADRSRNTGGTGLGLAIVQNIMDSHNGFIEIISDGKSGTEFKLIFPKDRITSR